MKKCSHVFWPFGSFSGLTVLGYLCGHCGEYDTLGPAAPHTEATRIELRAAEIAANPAAWRRANPSTVDSMEARGWWVHQVDLVMYDVAADGPKALAGYLARCIVSHEEGK